MNTEYKVFEEEWNAESESIVIRGCRSNFLLGIQERLLWDVARLEKVVRTLEMECRRFTADDVITMFHKLTKESSLFTFMHGVIAQLKQLGKVRTSETYTATLNSFMAFRNELDIPLDGISSDMMLMYEAHLKVRGVRMNTISFYMRNLRAVYNRAVEKRLTPQNYPFRHVYTGVDKTVKRAIPIKAIKELKELDLSLKPPLDFARDMFLFSFYTRGMSFVDMAYLKKSDLKSGILTYRRRKTGQQLTIKWEKCMEGIIGKYPNNEEGIEKVKSTFKYSLIKAICRKRSYKSQPFSVLVFKNGDFFSALITRQGFFSLSSKNKAKSGSNMTMPFTW